MLLYEVSEVVRRSGDGGKIVIENFDGRNHFISLYPHEINEYPELADAEVFSMSVYNNSIIVTLN